MKFKKRKGIKNHQWSEQRPVISLWKSKISSLKRWTQLNQMKTKPRSRRRIKLLIMLMRWRYEVDHLRVLSLSLSHMRDIMMISVVRSNCCLSGWRYEVDHPQLGKVPLTQGCEGEKICYSITVPYLIFFGCLYFLFFIPCLIFLCWLFGS